MTAERFRFFEFDHIRTPRAYWRLGLEQNCAVNWLSAHGKQSENTTLGTNHEYSEWNNEQCVEETRTIKISMAPRMYMDPAKVVPR